MHYNSDHDPTHPDSEGPALLWGAEHVACHQLPACLVLHVQVATLRINTRF
jgi:hypothetical protein